MDAEQSIRLIAEIELRLAFAGVDEGVGDQGPWLVTGADAPAEASP